MIQWGFWSDFEYGYVRPENIGSNRYTQKKMYFLMTPSKAQWLNEASNFECSEVGVEGSLIGDFMVRYSMTMSREILNPKHLPKPRVLSPLRSIHTRAYGTKWTYGLWSWTNPRGYSDIWNIHWLASEEDLTFSLQWYCKLYKNWADYSHSDLICVYTHDHFFGSESWILIFSGFQKNEYFEGRKISGYFWGAIIKLDWF